MLRLNVLLITLLATSACHLPDPLTPSNGPWRLSGTIFAVDGTRLGTPLAQAQLTLVSGASANTVVFTDAGGHYVFPPLESGRVSVNISAPGFVSVTPAIDLYSDLQLDFALKPR
jgi:hypothetical protein